MSLFVSERGIPLVTQVVDGDKPMLTVENYPKWYCLHLIQPNGLVEEISAEIESLTDLFLQYWYDHCIHPIGFKKVAQQLNAGYDIATYESVCRRFETDYLDYEDYD